MNSINYNIDVRQFDKAKKNTLKQTIIFLSVSISMSGFMYDIKLWHSIIL